MNTLVSFELAKLLKDKGFEYQYQWNPVTDNLPTIAEVVMWLYEKHRVWISVGNIDDSTVFRHCFSNIDFNSPTEAYEAAITYTLTNLI